MCPVPTVYFMIVYNHDVISTTPSPNTGWTVGSPSQLEPLIGHSHLPLWLLQLHWRQRVPGE